jgi:cytochrome d ubiquinol oxidase subunit I
MTDFFALLLNPNVQVQFPHTVLAGFTTAAFFVMGISAYHLMRKQNITFFRRSFQLGAIVGAFAILMVGLTGHSQAQEMVRSQPMKMAAAEALWYTENPASFSILTIGDLAQRRDVFAIRIPRLLSLLAYNQLSGEVKGIHDLQEQFVQQYGEGNYIPPVAVTYWSFRIMVGSGILLGILGLYALFITMGELYETRQAVWKIFPYAIALPYLSNTAGWLMTELGRVPWVVYGVMKIEDAISPTVSGGMVLFTLIAYTLIYAALMVATIYLLRKYALAGPTLTEGEENPTEVGLLAAAQPAQD